MQAVILAGGLGTRLGELTRYTPKVMLSFSGKPFLYYIIDLLSKQGVKDVVLCIGYLGEQIKDFFGDGKTLGVNVKYSVENRQLLGTGGALKQARNLMEEYFLVLNGDTYLPIDYPEVEKEYRRLGQKAMMVVYNNEVNTGVKNNVALGSDQVVVNYDKKGTALDLKYAEAGAVILQKEALDFIPEGEKISFEDGIYQRLIARGEMAAFVTRQRFYDIGTPEQRQTFAELVKKVSG